MEGWERYIYFLGNNETSQEDFDMKELRFLYRFQRPVPMSLRSAYFWLRVPVSVFVFLNFYWGRNIHVSG